MQPAYLFFNKVSATINHINKNAATHTDRYNLICTDWKCPRYVIPDSGAIAAFITAATGVTPRFLGKPYGEVVDMIEQVTGIDRRDMCIFGDRLYTDIALGTRHGVTSVLVLTGETSESDLAAAPADERPDMVYDSLHETDLALFGAGKEAEHGI